MQTIIVFLEDKIKNKTISLQDFSEVLKESNTDNSIKFIMSLCESELINDYLFSYFNNVRYTEEEINEKYGNTLGNILFIYGLTKNLIKEEVIDYKSVDTKNLDSTSMLFVDLQDFPTLPKETTLKYLKIYKESKALGQKELCERYRNLIIEGNLRLIIHIARRYITNLITIGDLTNEGVFGLSKAIEEYDLNFECAFSTYATYWIKNSLQRAYYKAGRSISLSVHFHERLNKLIKIKNEFMAKHGRDATIKELSAIMCEEEDQIKELMKINQNTISLDAKDKDNEGDDKYNYIPDSYSFEDDVINKLTVNSLKECLNAREQDIIMKRYFEDYSLEAVGRLYGLTRERIRQIEAKALRKMQEYSTRRLSCTIFKDAKIKSFLENKTLIEALGEEVYEKFAYYIQNSWKVNTLYLKAYGDNLDQVFDASSLSAYEIKALEESVTYLKRNPRKQLGSNLINKTLIDILKDYVPDLSYEELKNEVYVLWQEALVRNNAVTNILIKTFGISGDEPCNISNLSIGEKAKLIKKIYYMGNKLCARKDVRHSKYEGMTLDMILGISHKEVLSIFSRYNTNTNTYHAFVKVFGVNFTKAFNSTDLTTSDVLTIYNKINALKRNLSLKIEETSLSKYYRYLIMMLPYEYSEVLGLYLGIDGKKYNLENIASMLHMDISVVSDRVYEGLELIENMILSNREVKLTRNHK